MSENKVSRVAIEKEGNDLRESVENIMMTFAPRTFTGEKTGQETVFQLIISRAVLEADYIIKLPVFKTHSGMMITGALKNIYGYVAGACKARLHVQARNGETFAKTICDIFQVRPPDLHLLDAIRAMEGSGP